MSPPARPWLLLLAAFVAGFVIMGLEMAALRLVAPHLGLSIYVWGTLVAMLLAAMAAGSAVGGILADKLRSDLLLYGIFLFAGIQQASTLLWAIPLLAWLGDADEILASAVATLTIFVPAAFALAAVNPIAVRLLSTRVRVGRSAGATSAAATAGSIAGVLWVTFVSIPGWGVRATLLSLCLLSCTIAALGLFRRRWLGLASLLVAVAALALPAASEVRGSIVWARESPYNLVRIVATPQSTRLVLNRLDSIHGQWRNAEDHSGTYSDAFAAACVLVPCQRILVLGTGGGGSLLAFEQVAPDAMVDAVEVDPAVVEVAADYFGIRPSPHRRIHVDDARRFVERGSDPFDVIELDAFAGGPYVPFYLLTAEFFAAAARRTEPQGIVVVNVFDPGSSHELLDRVIASARTAFVQVLVADLGTGNHLLFAFREARHPGDLQAILAQSVVPSGLRYATQQVGRGLVVRDSTATPFSDDLAPVEAATRRALASFKP